MMTSALSREERRVDPGSAVRAVQPGPDEVRVRFGAPAEAVRYVRALASLCSGASAKVVATSAAGVPREDLTAEEISERLGRTGIVKLRFTLRIGGGSSALEIALRLPESTSVTIRVPLASRPATSRLWLQCDPDVVTPVPALALPTTDDGLALDAAHALVGLAIRCGGALGAELTGERAVVWSTTPPSPDALPLHGALRDASWVVGSASEGPPAAWVTGLPGASAPSEPDSSWRERLLELARAPRESLVELQAHLATVFDIPFAWHITDRSTGPAGAFVVQPEANAIAWLVPESIRVVLVVDLGQPAAILASALVHLCAHCALGHVGPGDSWGHWDTPESIASGSPHREWDREVLAYLDASNRRFVRRVSSIEECTPKEKGWLVLHDHIGRMVGQARTLHEATSRYQAAAYQRLAAQRLVAQLDEYGGAMLCDGVGLGKTYVATTVAVHYANTWREAHEPSGRTASGDPFRITILAPNSVVSTWQREAVPPLAAHGVPLATIRVISHSKL